MLSQLTTRAALQANTLSPDGGGGFTESWQTFASVWVKITPTGASDTMSADALASRARHQIVLRQRDDVFAGQRLVAATRTFKIHAVLDHGKREPYLTLLCEELP
jgi:SPP1 family predicted phage head-tail adaptor